MMTGKQYCETCIYNQDIYAHHEGNRRKLCKIEFRFEKSNGYPDHGDKCNDRIRMTGSDDDQ